MSSLRREDTMKNSVLSATKSLPSRCPTSLLSQSRAENLLPQSDRFRSDLDQLILIDEFNRQLQIQHFRWYQPNCLIRRRSAHVGQLLLANDIHGKVGVLRVFANDHPLVNIGSRHDEHFAALLEVVEGVA